MSKAKEWGFAEVWNRALESREERPVEPRDHMWAGELGKPPLEVFLKMKGVVPTNPPNARSLRKFEAGNTFEWLVSLVLKRAGILKESQQYIKYQFDGLVPVTGKADFIAGGTPDYEHWADELKALALPESFLNATGKIVEHMKTKYPEGLEDMHLEIKSCSAFMMNALEVKKVASKPHRLQLKHYLKGTNSPRGNVVYICRDDLRMMEIPVYNDNPIVEKEYRDAIEKVTGYYNLHKDTPVKDFLWKPATEGTLQWEYNANGIEGLPPLEKKIVFDEDMGKFARNWGVEYSSYLTMLYGFETQLQFEEYVGPTVARWNRVMGRVVRGDKMTDKNLAVLEELKAEGYDLKELASKFVVAAEEEETPAV